jgi:FAD/FMN-containing dehydrogenase
VQQLTGRVLDPNSPGWEAARHNFRSALDYDALVPAAIAFCQSAEDVQNAVRYARERGLPLRARSGRHSYEGYSLVGGGVIADVSELESIAVDRAAGTVRVGAGVYCLDLFERLYDVGLTVPAASGASVGIAGLALGGGFGVTSRLHGLTCDNLLEVELVGADGCLVRANAHQNPDLLWACQGGGGGNFGIATAFTFRAHPIGLVGLAQLSWTWNQFASVVDAWQHWGPVTDDRLSTFLRLATNGKITLYAMFTPSSPDQLGALNGLLAPMLAAAPPISVEIQAVPYSAAAAVFAGVDPVNPSWMLHPHNDSQAFKSTSAVAFAPFPAAALALLKAQIELAPPAAPWQTNQPSMIQFLGGGGAPSRVPVGATAMPHRAAAFVVQYDAYWTDPADAQRSTDWIEGVRTAMLPYAHGAYVNYVDHLIPDYLEAYYGPNLARLVEIKRALDPEDVFSFPQSIPTALPAAAPP